MPTLEAAGRMKNSFACGVIGLGALGSSVLAALSRLGVDAIGLDRFTPPHDRGSSHGESRITRLSVGEGDEILPLVRRSHEIWRALEAETGATLFSQCGFLLLSRPGGQCHGSADFLGVAAAAMDRHDVAYERLDAPQVQARFPAFALDENDAAIFEPTGGFLHPERCITAQLGAARRRGAAIRTDDPVLDIRAEPGGIRIITASASIVCAQIVLAAGPWIGRFAGPAFAPHLVTLRQTLHWYETTSAFAAIAEAMPSFIWLHGRDARDCFYGFPSMPGSGSLKIGIERYDQPIDPDCVDRNVALGESDAAHRAHLLGRIPGVTAKLQRSVGCIYTVTPDYRFLVDRCPDEPRIIAASACSGHGFKHAAGLGEAIAEQIAGARSVIDLSPFSLARYA